jgi:transcriptional antiterminator RfaH
MNTHWYAIRSKPHKEFLLHEQLLAREIECYFPRLSVTPVNPRSKKERPYFPGYIFVKTNIEEIGTNIFKWMPYAQNLVSFDGIPATVPEPVILQVKSMLEQINTQGGQESSKFSPGEEIRVAEGPFEGYEGIFDTQISGTDRVKVLLQLIGDRQISVEMNAKQIVDSRRR